jgi:hypothetical protein
MPTDIREQAIRSTMSVLRRAKDWQEGQAFLGDHAVYGPWIEQQAGGFDVEIISICQSIVREAEDRLGAELPY